MYVSGTITRIAERMVSLESDLLERSRYLPLQLQHHHLILALSPGP